MSSEDTNGGPIMRLFEVQAKPGCASVLVEKFATTSADVVQGEPGNKGYFFGRGTASDGDFVVFAPNRALTASTLHSERGGSA